MLNSWSTLDKSPEDYVDAFIGMDIEEIPLANTHIQSAMWIRHNFQRNEQMVHHLAQAIMQWPQLRETRSHIYQRRQTEKEWTYLPLIVSALDWDSHLFAVLADAMLTPYISDPNISTHKHLLPYDTYAPARGHVGYCSESTLLAHLMGKTMKMSFAKEDRKRMLLRWFSVQPAIWMNAAAGAKALGLGFTSNRDDFFSDTSTSAYEYYYQLCVNMYPEQKHVWVILRDGLFEQSQWWSTIYTIESISQFGVQDMLELPLEA